MLVPTATTTRPMVNSPTERIQPARATIVTIMKLITAIQKMDMRKEPVITYHFRFSEQLGMVQVKSTTKGKERTKRIHRKTYFTHPHLVPSSRASSMSGGTERMGGRQEMSTMTASSSSMWLAWEAAVALVLVLASSCFCDVVLGCWEMAM